MSSLREELAAFARGETRSVNLMERLRRTLAHKPEALQQIILELQEAYANGLIPAHTVVKLKAHAREAATASEAISTGHLRAASTAIRWCIESGGGPLPPLFVMELLLYEWRRFLAIVHRDYGDSSEQWRNAMTATRQLLWSVAPKATDNERKDLSAALDRIVASVKDALIAARSDPSTQATFLRQLADCHLSLVSSGRLGHQPGDAQAAGSDKETGRRGVRLGDTIEMNVHDPRYRDLADLLESNNVDQIEM